MLNAGIDLANIHLVFLLCYLLSKRNQCVAFASSIIYALLPMANCMSRIEHTHVISGFMVLLSFLFFVLYFQLAYYWERYIFLILSGVFTGFAALSHQELLFICLGYVVFLLVNLLHCLKKGPVLYHSL